MQVYDTLSVLTARPGAADLAKVPHHLYGHVPATATHSTGAWLRDIEATLDRLKQAGHVPVIVGGTGLYFRALTEGLADLPAIPPPSATRSAPAWPGRGPRPCTVSWPGVIRSWRRACSPTDSQRILRALEVLETTGRSLADLARHNQPPLVDPSRAMKFVVLPDRAVLAGRINDRFATMFERGAVDEVTALLAQSAPEEAPAMKAIGVPQIRAMLEGGCRGTRSSRKRARQPGNMPSGR